MEKQKKNKKKGMKLDENDSAEPMEEREIDSRNFSMYDAMEEICETSEKYSKRRKKKRGKDVKEDSNKKSIDVEEDSLESTKDEMKKKRKKKEINDKDGTSFSSPESFEKASDGEERARIVKESELEKNTICKGSKENVEDVKKESKKEKYRKSDGFTSLLTEDHNKESVYGKTIIAENTELLGNEEFKSSCNKNKKKRKRTYDSFDSEKDEDNTWEKVKELLSSEDKGSTDDICGSDKKKKKKKKEKKKDGATDSLTFAAEGISNEEKNDREDITEKAKRPAEDTIDKKSSSLRKKRSTDDYRVSRPKKESRRVSFSGEVEVFPPTNDSDDEEYDENNLVQGKRFSPKEDQMIKDAVFKYIETNQLGEDGLHMVLNCNRYPQIRSCWKEIGTSLPWRPYSSVYYRAHIILERSEKRGFEPEEYETIRRYHAEYGPRWKKLAEVLGKQRVHVKDAWRRIKLPNLKKGHWSQDEYQALFDLVNLDLRMKAFEEKKTKYGMLRENISWEAISEKLSTRTMSTCCLKWYEQLASPLVRQGEWLDSDDYRLLDALQKQDACCVEDVDWDSLLGSRRGEVCRKRWNEMVRNIGGHRERSFIEQVDVLSKRYCPDMLQYRK